MMPEHFNVDVSEAIWSKLGQVGAKLGPSWDQVGTKLRKAGQSWSQLVLSWIQVGPSWTKLGPREAMWRPIWTNLGSNRAKLGPSWDKVGTKLGVSWTILEPIWASLGSECGQDGLPRDLPTCKCWVWKGFKTKVVDVCYATQKPMRNSRRERQVRERFSMFSCFKMGRKGL